MRIHRAILRKDGKVISEVRYNVKEGILYHQNRSHDFSCSFDDFMDRLRKTKEEIKNNRKELSLEYALADSSEKWLA